MKDERHRLMQDIQTKICPEIEQLKFGCIGLDEISLQLLKRKLNTPSIRSYFIHQIGKYIIEQGKEEGIKLNSLPVDILEENLPFLAEAVMSNMYLLNQVYDHKGRVNTEEQRAKNIMGATLQKSKIFKYIGKRFSESDAKIIRYYTEEIFESVDIGQYFDKFHSYKVFRQKDSSNCDYGSWYLKFDEDNRLFLDNLILELALKYKMNPLLIRIYFCRNHLICSSLFKYFAEMLCDLLGYNGKARQGIIQFSELFGVISQLVNDNADFVYEEKNTTNKCNLDVLKDLNNLSFRFLVLKDVAISEA